MKKILFTSSVWKNDMEEVLRKALAAAIKKYGDGITVIVGYTAPHVKIAQIARSMGMRVHAFAPHIDRIPVEHLLVVDGMGITNLGEVDYMKHIATIVDGAVALDDKDPLVFHVASSGKKVWYPR
jgi:hypothetical protein